MTAFPKSPDLFKLQRDLKRKRTAAGLLNYGVIAFGPYKEDYWIRLTPKALFEHQFFTIRYLALVDVFVILGLVLWAMNVEYGFLTFLFALTTAVIVFVDGREIEKRTRMVTRSMRKPMRTTMEKTVRAVKKTPNVLKKIVRR